MKKIFYLYTAIYLTVIPLTAHAEMLNTNKQHDIGKYVTRRVDSVPPYAKWGVLAMNEVKNRYKVEIIDYLHVGRKEISPHVTQETFKFWVREASHLEYGIFVVIKFETKTEKVISIDFIKTNR